MKKLLIGLLTLSTLSIGTTALAQGKGHAYGKEMKECINQHNGNWDYKNKICIIDIEPNVPVDDLLATAGPVPVKPDTFWGDYYKDILPGFQGSVIVEAINDNLTEEVVYNQLLMNVFRHFGNNAIIGDFIYEVGKKQIFGSLEAKEIINIEYRDNYSATHRETLNPVVIDFMDELKAEGITNIKIEVSQFPSVRMIHFMYTYEGDQYRAHPISIEIAKEYIRRDNGVWFGNGYSMDVYTNGNRWTRIYDRDL